MIEVVNIEDIIDNNEFIFIDLRSPKEYNEDTIPHAINIPLFTDDERDEIGYVYKHVDKKEAKLLGLKYASYKLVDIYLEIKKYIDKNKKIALFCYRGGMRSSSIANILSIMGMRVFLINGGYKSYRNYVLTTLEKVIGNKNFIVLHGYTGVGKTILLNMLEDNREPVINLEKLANNSGSVFGNIPLEQKTTNQKEFESKLLYILKKIDKKYIFIESESRRIGKIILPEILMQKINEGKHLLLKSSIESRIRNILLEYVKDNCNNNKLISSVKMLNKRLGNKIIDDLVEKIKDKDYEKVIEYLMLNYYDPLYEYSIKKIKKYDKIIEYYDLSYAMNKLIEYGNSLNKKGD